MFLPPGFDKAIALEAGSLVLQAYAQFDQSKQGLPWTVPASYDLLGTFSAKGETLEARPELFGFVARNRASQAVFVVIRGTESVEDWLSDFTFPQTTHPWGKAEDGVSKLYLQCSPDIKTAVQRAGIPSNVFVTGHSLGAGMAILAMADLVISGIAPNAIMYSFAGLRVGDLQFAAKFNQSVRAAWRIANTEDIVPTVPLATPELSSSSGRHTPLTILLMLARNLNYEHVGVPVSFTVHNGSIAANHQMQVYLDAVNAS
jgi:triacylglycerol lipase